MRVLGISGYYHDSAAALVDDSGVVAAAQEERFSRRKHDARFPRQAVASCLREAGVGLDAVDHVVFYEKPLLKFERLLETYLAVAPRGAASWLSAMPAWLGGKLAQKREIREELAELSGLPEARLPSLLFCEHHQAHAASAFYPSGFSRAAVLCMDGVGEWATTSVWVGDGQRLEPRWQIDFPHSLGLLYSAFTYFAGFKVNSGEYKLMGLAPYGEPRFTGVILDEIVHVQDDGTFRLDLSYFDFATGLRMTSAKFAALFGGPPRRPEAPLTQREMDLARSVQEVTERIVLRLARTVRDETGCAALCLAGGVALNCVANGQLRRARIFDDLFVQPAAGDAGGALGAALVGLHEFAGRPRALSSVLPRRDGMRGALLGPRQRDDEVRADLDAAGAVYARQDDDELLARVAGLLADGAVVGWVSGRMEFGPRALGNRSILGDPRSPTMQSVMNLKIKQRESFRPFAPAVLAERAADLFDLDGPSPYMLFVAPVREALRLDVAAREAGLTGLARLGLARSTLPAVTHLDFSARVQTVDAETHPRFHRLLVEFERRTGCPALVNTSFNVRGEPIVCTAADAYRCFRRTRMDYLVVEQYLLAQADQPPRADDEDAWRREHLID